MGRSPFDCAAGAEPGRCQGSDRTADWSRGRSHGGGRSRQQGLRSLQRAARGMPNAVPARQLDAATRRHEHTVAIIESINRAASGSASIAAGLPLSTDSWFSEHYYDAATELLEFLGEESMHLEGLDVADVGCGDGIIDLGLVLRGKPRSFVGYDIKPTDVDQLREVAKREHVADDLPPNLTFETCQADRIPAADASYDLVVSWSAFEHVSDPPVVAKEIHRVLRPSGVLFIQLWPFFASEYGSHLDDWFPDGYSWIQGGFHHLTHSAADVELQMTERTDDEALLTKKLDEFRTLNRVTLDGLQSALLEADFEILKVKLLSHVIQLPRGLAKDHRLADLSIGGVELLAVRS